MIILAWQTCPGGGCRFRSSAARVGVPPCRGLLPKRIVSVRQLAKMGDFIWVDRTQDGRWCRLPMRVVVEYPRRRRMVRGVRRVL